MSQLNGNQKEAVAHNLGPCMVLAGPGAGKTRVTTHRMLRLIDSGLARPYEILALTFTKKAAQEMSKRLRATLGEEETKKIWLGTFHSLFSRILRIESEHLGVSRQFTIYDQEDSKALLKSLLKELKLDPKKYPLGAVLHRISEAKKKSIDPTAYEKLEDWRLQDRDRGMAQIFLLYKYYVKRCESAQALDFDDILGYTYRLFREHPEVLVRYQERFRYILVDEFQDTNPIQYALVKKISGASANLFVVGDDAQSIYAFQGANVKNMLDFKKEFPTAKIIKLEQNYRSTKRIVQLANGLIKNNKQHPKALFTENEEGEVAKLVAFYGEKEEARFMAEDIFMQHQQYQLPYSDFAIICRTNRQVRPFEDALRKVGIPYQVVGGLSFYQRKEVKDFVAYLRLLINPSDEQAIHRAINVPKRGIGPMTLEKMHGYARAKKISLWQSLQEVQAWTKGQVALKIGAFVHLIESHQGMLLAQSPHKVAKSLADASGLWKEVLLEDQKREEEGFVGVPHKTYLEDLLNALAEFEEENKEDHALATFLQEIALFMSEEEGQNEPKVTLITAHKAKGLEWRNVYVPGMVENVFPSWHMISNNEDIEEERRLFFVVLSRAQRRLTITYPRSKFIHGHSELATPSRFLRELDPSCLEIQAAPFSGRKPQEAPKKKALRPSSPPPRQLTPKRSLQQFPPQRGGGALPTRFTVGMKVRHDQFGWGEILKIHKEGPYPKTDVRFDQGGTKTFLLGYVKLTTS